MKKLILIIGLVSIVSSCNNDNTTDVAEKMEQENRTAQLKSDQKMALLELNMSEYSLSKSSLPYEEWVKTHPVKSIDEVIK